MFKHAILLLKSSQIIGAFEEMISRLYKINKELYEHMETCYDKSKNFEEMGKETSQQIGKNEHIIEKLQNIIGE